MSLLKDVAPLRNVRLGLSALVIAACSSFSTPLIAQQPKPSAPAPAQSVSQQTILSPALKQLLARGFDLREKHQAKDSREQFERALALAREEKNRWAEAEAHRGLALLLYDAAQYPSARTELEEALSIFLSLNDATSAARMRLNLGGVAGRMGNRAEARDLSQKALSEYRSLGDLRGQVYALLFLVYTEGIPENEIAAYRQQGLDLARKVGDRLREGLFLHQWGDHLFVEGDFAGALAKLQEAAACFEDVRAQLPLARVLNSLGRLHRAHGAYGDALHDEERALAIQQEVGDQEGVMQSLNAVGDAYSFLGKQKESIEHYERALALARQTGSPRAIAVMTGNLGAAYINLEEYERAIELLKESLRLDPSSVYAGNRYTDLSRAYRSIGRYDLALESADKAVDLTRKKGHAEILPLALQNRALAFEKLQQFSEGLSDIQEAIRSLEQLRGRLVPADYLKRGFADRNQDLFADAIRLHAEMGHNREAMAVAEEARARAFADLLAAREIQSGSSQGAEGAAPGKSEAGTWRGNDSGQVQKPASAILTMRGGESRRDLPLSKEIGALAGLASPASTAPPSGEQMVAVAKRLNSTILSYWVSPEATYIWALKPDGSVRAERAEVRADRLAQLVKATWPQGGEPPAKSAQKIQGASGNAPARREAEQGTMRLRGGGVLILSDSPKQAWRELYKLLILPVQEALPPHGSRLTIVPHGPLFLLSFGALLDGGGHYLVEDYALNYTPSVGVLQFTGERKQQLDRRAPRYLLVADPQLPASLVKDASLPPLPGARREAQAVARLLPADQTSMLVAAAASKEAVREQAPGKNILHFATHAIVRDDQPFDSFLALSSGAGAGDNGRLTAQEIYGLDLQADLVVLSACRTALGKVSGDGMVGLTRAFFYAGASSVMATLWDVADEPTSRLISSFYTSLQKGQDKSRALRAAQLRLLRELRAGRVKVKTPAGLLTLPEHPVFWAGFVLQGEP